MDSLKLKRLSLKMRFIYSFVFVIIITITTLSLANHFRWDHNYRRQVRDEGLILTQTLAQGSIDPIIRNDFYTLNEYVDNLIKKKNIVYVVITDKHDRILVQSPEAMDNIPQEINRNSRGILSPYLVQTYFNPNLKIKINDISVPVLIDSKKWGVVRVGFSLAHIRTEITKNIFTVIMIGLISVIIGIAVALILSRFVTGPIEKFVESMETVAAGNLEQQIQIDTTDEFGILAGSFNQMSKSLRENKEELKRTYHQLMQKEKMAALGELTARIAHEIKNPLGIIKGSAQILVDETEETEVKTEVGGFIIEEVNRLDLKVRDLLNHAKPKPLSLEEIDLNRILEERIQFWESQKFKGKKIRIIRKYNKSIPLLFLDKEQIRQVILNMIINSYEAMPESGEITVTTDWNSLVSRQGFDNEGGGEKPGIFQNNGYVLLTFQDTGTGISEKNLPKIFDPFFTTKENGSGLGLSTVHRIIENHRGRIEVESSSGEGSTFKIFFPLTILME